MKKIKLKIKGMTCEGCSRSVSRVLERMGAKDISVSLEKGEAEFSIENMKKIEDIKREIEILGYKVE